MLDGLTIDQLRTFIAAADTGSFSAAGRSLGRAQSVVSQTLTNLEAQIGIKVFDRSGRFPVLTDAGRALLGEARMVAGGMDQFKAAAKGLAGGLEPEVSVAVDVMFPIEILTAAVSAFQAVGGSSAAFRLRNLAILRCCMLVKSIQCPGLARFPPIRDFRPVTCNQ